MTFGFKKKFLTFDSGSIRKLSGLIWNFKLVFSALI